MEVRIDPEIRKLIPPLMPAERDGLEHSLIEHGCREPLVLWRNTLLDGHHRHEICTEHGIAFDVVNYSFDDQNAAMAWVIENQFSRRNLTLYQRGELALKLKPLVAEAAEKRMKGGHPVPNLAQGKARDELAAAAGVSHGTLAKVEYLAEHADAETKEKLSAPKQAGGVSVDAAYKAVRKARQQAAHAKQRNDASAVAGRTCCVDDLSVLAEQRKRFGTIYADPPWLYGNQGTRAATSNHYAGMTVEEIAALPVASLAAPDAHLHLWTTNAFLFERWTATSATVVLLVVGDAKDMSVECVAIVRRGRIEEWKPSSLDDLRRMIRVWGEWAKSRVRR